MRRTYHWSQFGWRPFANVVARPHHVNLLNRASTGCARVLRAVACARSGGCCEHASTVKQEALVRTPGAVERQKDIKTRGRGNGETSRTHSPRPTGAENRWRKKCGSSATDTLSRRGPGVGELPGLSRHCTPLPPITWPSTAISQWNFPVDPQAAAGGAHWLEVCQRGGTDQRPPAIGVARQ